MNSKSVALPFRTTLLNWYETHQRNLPWRQTRDPYAIWLSEIILQQTRVEQGQGYYHRFITTFPDVQTLAAAPLQEVLKCWQGLGYYSRARNLHATAKALVNDHQGRFPETYEGLLTLKGVGSYTAAAIASIAYRQPHAVLDGNVFRVLARLFLIDTPIHSTAGKKQFAALADTLLDPHNPDTYNQAIMDFGALQCVPSKPDCARCPMKERCLAHNRDAVALVPVRKAETAKRVRYFYYFVCRQGNDLFLRERTGKDVWQHLWEFPLVETEQPCTLESLLSSPEVMAWLGDSFTLHTPVSLKHTLSHQLIHALFVPVDIVATTLSGFTRVSPSAMETTPVSRLIDLYLSNL